MSFQFQIYSFLGYTKDKNPDHWNVDPSLHFLHNSLHNSAHGCKRWRSCSCPNQVLLRQSWCNARQLSRLHCHLCINHIPALEVPFLSEPVERRSRLTRLLLPQIHTEDVSLGLSFRKILRVPCSILRVLCSF